MLFFDEGRFGLQSTLTRVWAEKGKPVQVRVKQGYKNCYMYTAVSPFPGTNFSLIMPGVNTTMMNVYLHQLAQQFYPQPILLLMDQAGWHRSHDLDLPPNLTIKYLPPYSPELNPIEKLWEWFRKEVTHNRVFNSLAEIIEGLSEEYQRITAEENAKIRELCHCSYL